MNRIKVRNNDVDTDMWFDRIKATELCCNRFGNGREWSTLFKTRGGAFVLGHVNLNIAHLYTESNDGYVAYDLMPETEALEFMYECNMKMPLKKLHMEQNEI